MLNYILDTMTYKNTTDIDECAAGDNECNHFCVNTIGSFLCNCSGPGYRLQSDSLTCLSELVIKFTFHITTDNDNYLQ